MGSVLIVEDSEADHLIAQVMLEKNFSSIEIHQAYDGEEALEMIHKGGLSPDVILLDINMPRMNGLEFLKVYSSSNRADSNVLMLTSSSQASDKAESMGYECVKDYFVKPFKPAHIEILSKYVG